MEGHKTQCRANSRNTRFGRRHIYTQVITTNNAREGLEAQQNLEEERAREAELQTYFDDMGSMILDDNHPLPEAKPGGPLSSLARAKTLTILERLDGQRKRIVLQFLAESQLIRKGAPVINLSGANLIEADLGGTDLGGTDLGGADLRKADLMDADLRSANLSGANLSYVYSIDADLSDADLGGADLMEAYLENANLSGADLSEAHMREADLTSADLTDANLSGAYLGAAYLQSAVLISTDLTDADLGGADLTYAHIYTDELRGADLGSANLSGAHLAVNESELESYASSLRGTTMPDRSEHP